MSHPLQARAQELLLRACEQHPIGYVPKIVWKRFRVTAGQAHYKTGVIALSSILLNEPSRLETTLLHEYAHLMAYVRHGRKGVGHGEAWKAAMREVGLEPIVRHKYEVQRNVARQEVAYSCQRCGATLLRRRKLPSRRRYVHANCGGSLKLQAVRPATAARPLA